MTGANGLRVIDVRDAYRLIGECRDLGADPALWQSRLFEGLSRLFGGAPANGGEGRIVGASGGVVPLSAFDAGFDAAERRTYLAYLRDGGPAVDPFVRALQRAGTPLARTRRALLEDGEYYRSPAFDRWLRQGNVDHRLASIFPSGDGSAVSFLHLHRGPGARDFSGRERTLLEFFHGELGPLIGRALVSIAEPTPAGLSRRLRQTLACLMEGDSERQVAARLGVSRATAHQYVTALYRRFGVHSRGQLLAHVLRRRARPEWRDLD